MSSRIDLSRYLKDVDPNIVAALPPSLQAMWKAQTSSKKRARSESSDQDGSDDDEDQLFTLSCDQIRTRINAYLRSGEMKVTEFQRHLGINSNSYGRFMKLKGSWSGVDNQTMSAAHAFFKKREAKGIKMPRAKKPKPEDVAKYDVSGTSLDGEEDESVPIHDTCDDVRKKIQAHLRNSGMTQAAFMREIGKTYTPPKTLSAGLLTSFLKKNGPTEGNSSSVYYAAYVYFEKLRIQKGDKKTEKRMTLEGMWPVGMSREYRGQFVLAHASQTVAQDQYGRIHVY